MGALLSVLGGGGGAPRGGWPGGVVLVLRVGEPVRGEGAFHEPADAFAGVFIDDGADLDRSALLVGIELEIDCPDPVRLGRCRRVDGRGTDAFAAPTPRAPQALLPPEPLDLLMIDAPASPRALGYAHRYPLRVLLRVRTKPVSCNARSGTALVSAWSGHRYADLLNPTRPHAIRSLTNSVRIKGGTQAQRLPGPRSFPQPTPSKPPSPTPPQRATASAWRSASQAPSTASPHQP